MFKCVFYFLMFISLSACREDSLESTKNRAFLANANDLLASCKTYSQTENFFSDQKLCGDFEYQNKECATFLETKPECTVFLNDPSYVKVKYLCSGIVISANKCSTLVHERLWYKWAFYFQDNVFLKNTLRWFNIDLDKKWNALLADFNLKIKIAVILQGEVKDVEEEFQGIDLAVQQINTEGGVLGRMIELKKYEANDLNESIMVAHKIADDTSTVAVINGLNSDIARYTARIYESSGVLNLIIFATNMDVINSDMNYTFRMIPDNKYFAEKTAQFFNKQGYKKVAILSERDSYSEELSNAFYNNLLQAGIEVNYYKTFSESKVNFINIISEINEKMPDAIYYSGWIEYASNFVIKLKKMNVHLPVIGTDSLISHKFLALAGGAAEGFIAASVYNNKSTDFHNTNFLQLYKKKYGTNPTMLAAQSYDSVKLLMILMTDIDSTIPAEIASRSKSLDSWVGVSGKFQSDKKGGVKKDIFFKQVSFGEFHAIDE